MSQPQPQPQPQSQPSSTTSSPAQTQRTNEAKAAFTASLRSVGANYDAELRERARNLHDNATVLEEQEAELRRTTAALSKQNDQWAKVADQARDGLKEIGDVQNWAELIERDLLVVEETLRLAEARGGGGGEEEDEGEDEDEGGRDEQVVVNGKGKGEDDQKRSWLRWW